MAKHTIEHLLELTTAALTRAGAGPDMAASTAKALVGAEAQGLASHGLARVSQYAAHLRNGRVNGDARPKVVRERAAACLIDAEEGLAFPACDLAIKEAIERARKCGVAFAGVTRSHHFGVAAQHLEAVAAAGMVGLAFGNSPAAMPAWGGKRALFGTNPIAAVFPRRDGDPVTIDLALSEVARGKLMVAARDGKSIPTGWALDRNGEPTTDPKAGLEGMMCPAGGVKGAMLAMIVELLCCSLTGAAFGFEADSFFVEEGNRPNIGQAFLVIDPGALGGTDTYLERIETLMSAMFVDEGVRVPGDRRRGIALKAQREGVEVADAVIAQLV
ncbi:MAG: Ldh family oxidoreductase [Azoarcus sp.]